MANGQNHNCLLSSYLYIPKLEPGLAFVREASYCQKMLITAEITTSQCVENKRLEPSSYWDISITSPTSHVSGIIVEEGEEML